MHGTTLTSLRTVGHLDGRLTKLFSPHFQIPRATPGDSIGVALQSVAITVPRPSRANAPAKRIPSTKMKTLRNYILAFCAVAGGWLAVSLLCWPILLALQALTTTVFIPHPAGSYIAGFVSTARLLDFPTSFVGAFSVPFMNMPLGFIAIAWWFAAWLIVPAAYRRYRTQAARPRVTNGCVARSPPGLVTTAVLLLVAIPFLRRYEIVTPDHLYVRHLFDWHERAYPLASLKEIHVDDPDTSRIITWDFIFDGDNRFTTTAPTSTRSSTCCRTHPQRPTSRSSGNELMKR